MPQLADIQFKKSVSLCTFVQVGNYYLVNLFTLTSHIQMKVATL